MRALTRTLQDLRELPQAFVNTGFGHTRDGRPIFMPYGEWGGSYIVETQTRLRRMRRQLSWLLIVPGFTFLAVVSLLIRPVRDTVLVPVLLFVAVSFAAWACVFSAWAWLNTRSMTRLEEGEDSVPVQVDPLEAGAASLRRYLVSLRLENAHLFGVAGALAGFACQMVVRDRARIEGRPSGLVEVALKDGRLLYFGDELNGPLAEDATSVWSIVGEGTPIEDILHMFKDAIAVLTNGVTPPGVTTTVASVQRFWPATVAILDVNDVPAASRHLAIARAIRAMQHSRSVLPSGDAVRIVMRAAILMSRWDPADVLIPDETVDLAPSKAASGRPARLR